MANTGGLTLTQTRINHPTGDGGEVYAKDQMLRSSDQRTPHMQIIFKQQIVKNKL